MPGHDATEQGAVFLQALQTALEQVEVIEDEDESPVGPRNATAVAYLPDETQRKLLEEQRQKQVNGPKQRKFRALAADGGSNLAQFETDPDYRY